MSTLSSSHRKSLPASSFGMPGERKYPMPDRSHAGNAKARASQQESAGNISESTKEAIDAKANRMLKPEQSKGGKSSSDGKGHYSGH